MYEVQQKLKVDIQQRKNLHQFLLPSLVKDVKRPSCQPEHKPVGGAINGRPKGAEKRVDDHVTLSNYTPAPTRPSLLRMFGTLVN